MIVSYSYIFIYKRKVLCTFDFVHIKICICCRIAMMVLFWDLLFQTDTVEYNKSK